MKKKLLAGLLAVSLLGFTSGGVMTSHAFDLGSILKIGGVGYAVDRFGEPTNKFLNKIMAQHSMGTSYATKVVPILSIGSGGYIGAAQVTGPRDQVNKVEAVAQIEGNFNGLVRVRGLVPVDSKNPMKAKRIQGVGISALIDVHF